MRHTVDALRAEGLSVEGTVCHVGKEEHRKQLIQEVSEQEVVGAEPEIIVSLLGYFVVPWWVASKWPTTFTESGLLECVHNWFVAMATVDLDLMSSFSQLLFTICLK